MVECVPTKRLDYSEGCFTSRPAREKLDGYHGVGHGLALLLVHPQVGGRRLALHLAGKGVALD